MGDMRPGCLDKSFVKDSYVVAEVAITTRVADQLTIICPSEKKFTNFEASPPIPVQAQCCGKFGLQESQSLNAENDPKLHSPMTGLDLTSATSKVYFSLTGVRVYTRRIHTEV